MKRKICVAVILTALIVSCISLYAKTLEIEVPDGMSGSEEQTFIAGRISSYKEVVNQADAKIRTGAYLALGGLAVLGMDLFVAVAFSMHPVYETTPGSTGSRDLLYKCLGVVACAGAGMTLSGLVVLAIGGREKQQALEKLQITPVPFSAITDGYPVYGMKMIFRF